MKTYRYPLSNIIGDYVRASAGLLFVLVLALLTQLGTVIMVVFLALSALFFVYGARTVNRHLTRMELDDIGIRAVGGITRQLRWKDVEKLDLRYFSTRRDRQAGWMQLRLDGAGTAVRIDSQIGEFGDLVQQACSQIPLSQITLGETTMVNLNSFGLSADTWPAEETSGATGEA